MSEERKYRYTVKKDGVVIDEMDCVHVARHAAESRGAQLWRNLPDRSYMVTDYAVPPGEERDV